MALTFDRFSLVAKVHMAINPIKGESSRGLVLWNVVTDVVNCSNVLNEKHKIRRITVVIRHKQSHVSVSDPNKPGVHGPRQTRTTYLQHRRVVTIYIRQNNPFQNL